MTTLSHTPLGLSGDAVEECLTALADAIEGGGNPAEHIRLARFLTDVGKAIESAVKDRHYEATIGVIGENVQIIDGVKFTTVAPGQPKTTPAHYEPDAAVMMELMPPHECADAWRMVPAQTKPGRRGYVAVEILD